MVLLPLGVDVTNIGGLWYQGAVSHDPKSIQEKGSTQSLGEVQVKFLAAGLRTTGRISDVVTVICINKNPSFFSLHGPNSKWLVCLARQAMTRLSTASTASIPSIPYSASCGVINLHP